MTRQHRDILLALSFAVALSALSLRITDVQLPLFASRFSASLTEVSWVVTAYGLAYGLALPVLGTLGDRLGKIRCIAMSCCAAALASTACAGAWSLPLLVAARAACGVAMASIVPMAMAWIGDEFDYQVRQPVLARFLIGQIAGMSLGVGLGGVTADYLSPATTFLVIACGFAVIGLWLLRVSWRQGIDRKPAAAGPLVAGMRAGVLGVLAERQARFILMVAALEGACLFGVIAFTATHFHQALGVSLSSAGGMVMLLGAGGLVYAMRSGFFVRRLGERGMAYAGGALMAGSIALMAWSPWWSLSLLACLACGLGYYMMHNTLQTRATQMSTVHRSAAMSLYSCCFFMGQAAGVACFGLAQRHMPMAVAMSLCAVALAVLSLCFGRRLGSRP